MGSVCTDSRTVLLLSDVCLCDSVCHKQIISTSVDLFLVLYMHINTYTFTHTYVHVNIINTHYYSHIHMQHKQLHNHILLLSSNSIKDYTKRAYSPLRRHLCFVALFCVTLGRGEVHNSINY